MADQIATVVVKVTIIVVIYNNCGLGCNNCEHCNNCDHNRLSVTCANFVVIIPRFEICHYSNHGIGFACCSWNWLGTLYNHMYLSVFIFVLQVYIGLPVDAICHIFHVFQLGDARKILWYKKMWVAFLKLIPNDLCYEIHFLIVSYNYGQLN